MIKRLTKAELLADRTAVDAMIATMQADHQAKQLRSANHGRTVSQNIA